ncbi:unnamed protein product [Caenorhabditis brenneri]
MPTLLEMPDITMLNILEKCSYKSVLTLRKVCHSLRTFIDDSCFKTDLDNIQIFIFCTSFSVICHSPKLFLTNGNGFGKNWTSSDLKIILKMAQNSKLSYFSVITNPDNAEGLDDLEDLLKNQTRPLQTTCFRMDGSEILKVLPYLDSKTLKNIAIVPPDYKTLSRDLVGIEKVMELEQFKNAVELDISYCFLVRADLRKFFHFQRVRVNLHETSLEERVALKEAFVTSTHMEFFDLNSRGLNEDQFEQVFGTPFHDPYRGWQWFFKIKNCKEHVLNIEWNSLSDSMLFEKWKAKEVPQDAVVQH